MLLHVPDLLLERVFPVIQRCLGKDENYDLRMDTAMVSQRDHMIMPCISNVVCTITIVFFHVALLFFFFCSFCSFFLGFGSFFFLLP